MTALEYMKKQMHKHHDSYARAVLRNAPDHELQNIKLKIGYYEAAINALKKVGDQ